MSKYTSQLRFICESLAGLDESVGFNDVDRVVAESRNKIFGNYPIFDEAYREQLETKILKHYYTREICAESFGLWKLWLNNTMNEIMPYYNKLYKSELLEFNPLYTMDYRTVRSKNNASNTNGNEKIQSESDDKYSSNDAKNTTSENKENSTGWNLYSDTPQGGIGGINGDLQNNTFLTNATKVTNDTNNNSSGSVVGIQSGNNKNIGKSEKTSENSKVDIESYTERVFGKNDNKSYSELIKEFRNNFLNIDEMIIDRLSDLFMLIW